MSITASLRPDQSEAVRVLHVDDEPELADLTAAFLTREDERFEVTTATSAADGLDLLAQEAFDCVISDYDMPGRTGIEFLEGVREQDDELPFILYTGKGSEEVASDAISAGVTDYLQKQPGSDQYTLLANRVANAVEQYRARQTMENTRRRFRTLVEEATDAILIVEPDGTLAYVTPAAETILGRPPADLVGTSGFDPIHPDDREHVMAEFGSLVDNPDDRRTVEFRYRQPDGSYIWAEARGRNLLDEPLINGIVVYTRDITDRKERELELQRQERRYQAIFNDPNILVGLIDTDGSVLDINQKAMAYVDGTPADVVGEPFWETPWFDHSEDVEAAVKQWIDRASENEYVEFETELVRPNGEPYTVAGVFRPVTNDDGEVVSLIISDRDITAQKAYERELETVQRRFEAVLENTTTPLFMKDDDGAYIFVNHGYRDLFGLEDEDIVGRTDLEIHPPDVAAQVRENDQLVLDRGEVVETEERVVADGTERTFLSTKVPIYDTGDRSDPEQPIAVFGVASDITELKEREERLDEMASRLEVLFDNSPDMIDVLDPEGQLRDVNRRFCEELGYDEDELRGRPIWEIDQSVTAEAVTALLTDFALDERRKFEGVYERRDGSTFPVEVHLLRLDIEGANRFIAISRDITERKQYEQTITALHDAAQEIFQAETTDGVAEIVVEAARDILGMSINGVALHDESENVLRTIASTDRSKAIVGDAPVFRPGESLAWDVFESGEPQHHDDVSTVPGRANPDTSIRSEIIVPLGTHGVALIGSTEADVFEPVDLSLVETLATHAEMALDRIDRKRALERSEARYRSLADDVLDTSSVGTFVLDADFEVVWINEATEEYFGLDRAAVIGADKRQLIHDLIKHTVEDPASFATTVLATYDDNTYVEEFECRVLPVDGRGERWLKHWSQPIESGLYEGGRIEHYTDITERKHREQELTQQNDRLEQFASIVSHDLRNPLTVAEGRLALAKDECGSEHLDAVGAAHERMSALIDDLLTLAHHGHEVGDTESVDLAALTERCWQNVATDEASLEAAVTRPVRADSSRLQQLLENLFRNAIEHGGPDVTVTVGAVADGFYVEDDGPGIPVDERDDVFEAGYSTAEDGTGFGLSIVKQVADAHGWTVRVTDGSDGGARFEITGVGFTAE